MGRYYQVGLKDKSEESIKLINDILEKEFKAPVKVFEDGFKDTIFITNKYMKEEFKYVKTHKNYNEFSFSKDVSQEKLTYKRYLNIRASFFDKIGYSRNFKISCPTELEAKQVYALSKMVDSEKYKNLFITVRTKKSPLIDYAKFNVVEEYVNYLIK